MSSHRQLVATPLGAATSVPGRDDDLGSCSVVVAVGDGAAGKREDPSIRDTSANLCPVVGRVPERAFCPGTCLPSPAMQAVAGTAVCVRIALGLSGQSRELS